MRVGWTPSTVACTALFVVRYVCFDIIRPFGSNILRSTWAVFWRLTNTCWVYPRWKKFSSVWAQVTTAHGPNISGVWGSLCRLPTPPPTDNVSARLRHSFVCIGDPLAFVMRNPLLAESQNRFTAPGHSSQLVCLLVGNSKNCTNKCDSRSF